MPQVFQVLKCYKCLIFQIHQTKKSNKFQCKMCGEKQSIKRHYGLGSGLDCRKHVQKLNLLKGEIDESKLVTDEDIDTEDENISVTTNSVLDATRQEIHSKWSDFVDTEDDNIKSPSLRNDTMYLNDTEVVLEIPKKRHKTLGSLTKNPKYTKFTSKSIETDDPTEDQETRFEDYSVESITDVGKRNFLNQVPSINVVSASFTKPVLCNEHKNSQKADQRIIDDRGSEELDMHNNIIKKVKPHFIAPKVNKDSKWAKFAEEEAIDEPDLDEAGTNVLDMHSILLDKSRKNNSQENFYSDNISERQDSLGHNSNINTKTLFSLCDDSDIDDCLNI